MRKRYMNKRIADEQWAATKRDGDPAAGGVTGRILPSHTDTDYVLITLCLGL